MRNVKDIEELTIAIDAVTRASIRLISQPKVTRPIEIAMENLFQLVGDIEAQAFIRGREAARKEMKHEKCEQRLRALEDNDIEKRCIKPKTNRPITRWGKGWKTQN